MIVNSLAPPTPSPQTQSTKSNHHPEPESTLGCADKFDEGEGSELR